MNPYQRHFSVPILRHTGLTILCMTPIFMLLYGATFAQPVPVSEPVPSHLRMMPTNYESLLEDALNVEQCLHDALAVHRGDHIPDIAWQSCRLAAKILLYAPYPVECEQQVWEQQIPDTSKVRRKALAMAFVILSCPQEIP